MFLYQIALESKCWYVGTTVDIKRRINEHVNGHGAAWTRLHKPLEPAIYFFWEIPSVSTLQVEDMEDVLTVSLMKKYGIQKVRGGYRITCRKMKKILPRNKARWVYFKIKYKE
jgi:hypothetical protein